MKFKCCTCFIMFVIFASIRGFGGFGFRDFGVNHSYCPVAWSWSINDDTNEEKYTGRVEDRKKTSHQNKPL